MGARKATGTAGRREFWDADRWLSYGERLHRIVWLIDEALESIGNTKGRIAPTIDFGLAVIRQVETAMVSLESVVAEHFGGWDRAPSPLNRFVQHWFNRPERTRTPARPRRSVLSRDEWVAVGNTVKDAYELAIGLHVEFANECRGKDRKRHELRIRRVANRIQAFKCRLDSIVCGQHPDWEQATRVFYGPRLGTDRRDAASDTESRHGHS